MGYLIRGMSSVINMGVFSYYNPDYTRGLTKPRGKSKVRALSLIQGWEVARIPAQVVKLVDTLASGASGGNPVEVQVLSWAPLLFNYRKMILQNLDPVLC